jgi:hypothetical protein
MLENFYNCCSQNKVLHLGRPNLACLQSLDEALHAMLGQTLSLISDVEKVC